MSYSGPICMTQIRHDVLNHKNFEKLHRDLQYALQNPENTPSSRFYMAVYMFLEQVEPAGYTIVRTPLRERK